MGHLVGDGMSMERRQFLQIVPYVVGSGILLSHGEFALAQAVKAPENDASKGTDMEKVAGIGGLFFRAHDPKALGNWYQQHLGVTLTPTTEGGSVWQQEAGPTAFTPFSEKSSYFGDLNKTWMVNFRVHDMTKMVAQLRAAGIEVTDPESYPNIGHFARLHDPEGNPIELWQPA